MTLLTAPELEVLRTRSQDVTAEQAVALAWAQAAADGTFFLRFVQTRDEADPEQTTKPFPLHLAYLTDLWRIIDKNQRVVIAKSRQMMISWLMAAYCVWYARFHANSACYYQTKAFEDAVAMVAMPEGGFEGRCQFIESHLPAWLHMDVKISEGRVQYPNGSIIQALAGGADKIRGKVASVVVEDEFGHQEDQTGVFTAVAPLIQKGTRAIFVSTPNGSDNFYCTLYHGHAMNMSYA
jgi:phage FluMu gp28-like protein